MAPSDLDWLSIIELDLELDPLKILAIAQLFVNWIRRLAPFGSKGCIGFLNLELDPLSLIHSEEVSFLD